MCFVPHIHGLISYPLKAFILKVILNQKFCLSKWLIMLDFMIIFFDSVHVGQFPKTNSSELFVRLSSRVSGSGHAMHGSQLSQLDSAPPSFSFSNHRGRRSSINTTLKL